MWAPLFALCLAMCHIAGLSAEIIIDGNDNFEWHSAYPSSLYKVFSDRLTWADSVIECYKWGANLVVIDSEEEAAVIRAVIGRTSEPYSWVEIMDDFSDGFWQKVTGGQLRDSAYNKWSPGEPNGGEKENCGFIYPDALYRDLPCSQPAPYICERTSSGTGFTI